MNPLRVLIVDDNERNAELATFVLERAGFEVEVQDDGERVVEVVAQLRPDIVLMDIELPGVDGLTLTRWLRADPRTCDVPLLAVTAFAMQGDEARMLDAGCNGYIAKPINVATFAQRVRAAIPGSEAR